MQANQQVFFFNYWKFEFTVYKRCIPSPGISDETIQTIVGTAEVGKFWKALANIRELNELSEVNV